MTIEQEKAMSEEQEPEYSEIAERLEKAMQPLIDWFENSLAPAVNQAVEGFHRMLMPITDRLKDAGYFDYQAYPHIARTHARRQPRPGRNILKPRIRVRINDAPGLAGTIE